MVTAVVISGGSGVRAGQAVPKQFLTVNDIPIIVYTLINLQEISEIEKITVVVASGWENFVSAYAKQFGITKLKEIVIGGKTRNESIYNGLRILKDDGETDKVCLVDANRPLIPKSVIVNALALMDMCDCVLTADPCYDSMFISSDGALITDNIDRSVLYKGVTPECASLSTLLALYEEESSRINCTLSTSGLAVVKGMRVLISKGHNKCFKITTAEDFELFKAYLAVEPLNNITCGLDSGN